MKAGVSRSSIRKPKLILLIRDRDSRHVHSYKGYRNFSLPLRNKFRNNRCPAWPCSGNLDGHTFLEFPCLCTLHFEVHYDVRNPDGIPKHRLPLVLSALCRPAQSDWGEGL